MASFLVTGGAGFIGSNIVLELARKGHKVSILDNFSTGKKENLAEVTGDINLIEGELQDLEAVKRSVEGVDYVIHQGAVSSVSLSLENPLLTHQTNVTGTLNVLLASYKAQVKRVIYASSCAVYGDYPTLPLSEEKEPKPSSLYAASKLAAEYYCRVFYSSYGLETVSLRYFNVFGPRQDPSSEYSAVIPKFINLMLKGRPPVIYGDGKQSRDFVYIDDVVLATTLAATKPEAAGQVFNVGSGRSYTVNRVVDKLGSVLEVDIEPVYDGEKEVGVKESLADVSKAVKMLNYRSKTSFDEGLSKTVKWYRSLLGGNNPFSFGNKLANR